MTLAAGTSLAPYAIGGRAPGRVARPTDPDEVAAVLKAADATGEKVVPWGAGTKQRWGNPPRAYDVALDVSRLDRVLEYEPADLVVTVQAGMTLAALQERLNASGQFLPLDPPYAMKATVGGTLAANASGPMRFRYGAARDFVLGLRVATPQGELVRSGGRVVKNVVGYDLNKLHVGGFGTAGVIVEATFKVQPRHRETLTIRAAFPDLARAHRAAQAVARSNLYVEAIDLVQSAPPSWAVLVECAGSAATVERQARDVSRWCIESGAEATERLDVEARLQAWERPELERSDPSAAVLKLTCLPSQLATLLGRAPANGAAWARAGNGVAYVPLRDPTVDEIRRLAAAAHELGGSAVVEEAPDTIKLQIDSWDPADIAATTRTDLDLMRSVKAQFDPRSTLNPGRFVAGI